MVWSESQLERGCFLLEADNCLLVRPKIPLVWRRIRLDRVIYRLGNVKNQSVFAKSKEEK